MLISTWSGVFIDMHNYTHTHICQKRKKKKRNRSQNIFRSVYKLIGSPNSVIIYSCLFHDVITKKIMQTVLCRNGAISSTVGIISKQRNKLKQVHCMIDQQHDKIYKLALKLWAIDELIALHFRVELRHQILQQKL